MITDENEAVLFDAAGYPPLPEGLSPEAERAYAVVLKGLADINMKLGNAASLEAAHGAILGAADWAQVLTGSPIVAHELVAPVANAKWRLAKLARKTAQ